MEESDIIAATAILYRSTPEIIGNLPITEAPILDVEFLKTPIPLFEGDHITIKGKKYSVQINPIKLSVQQYVDYNTFLSENASDMPIKCLAVLMDIPFEEALALLEDCPMSYIIGLTDFFQKSYRRCAKFILSSMIRKIKRIKPSKETQVVLQSLKDGVDLLKQ